MQIEKEKIRILIVDDHALVADAWKLILNSIEHFEVIGIKESAEDALIFCLAQKPDIVLMDLNLKDSNGFDATENINNQLAKTRIIGLSMHDDVSVVKRFLALGAKGYLSKNSKKEELVAAIEAVMLGNTFVSAEIKDKIFMDFSLNTENQQKKELTTKEIEIVKLITKGLTSKEIADQLFLSPRTVETHRHNILKKLNLPNAAQLSRWASEKGYI
jgi:DNA-binding NarL/FixJ family response regulator